MNRILSKNKLHQGRSATTVAVILVTWMAGILAAAEDPTIDVDPFIGVDKHGNVPPGAALPFSLVRLGPDTLPPQQTSGYATGKPVIGFSHTHTSGTGGAGRYGNVLVSPRTGNGGLAELADRASPVREERGGAGWYHAVLERWAVTADLTQTERCGVHRYTFARGAEARLLVDAGAFRRTQTQWDVVPSAISLRVVSNREIEGCGTFTGGWGNKAGHGVWFVAVSDQPFTARLWRRGSRLPAGTTALPPGNDGGAELAYALADGASVDLRVGISFSSFAHARAHLAQGQGRNFASIQAAAASAWRQRLDCIRISGGTPEQRRCFTTALYHAMLMPTDVTGDAPGWPDGQPHFWDFYTLWDTFHTVNPLYALVQPEQAGRIVACLTAIGQRTGWVPDAWIAGAHAAVQGGSNGDVVVAEAILKQVPGFDRGAAYQAVRRNAVEDPGQVKGEPTRGRFLTRYNTFGYLPSQGGLTTYEDQPNPVSRSLEYAYNDYCLSLAAAALGYHEDAARFATTAKRVWNLFHPQRRMFWPKSEAGAWLEEGDPKQECPPWRGPFYEGTPWQYAFSAPHDVQGLVHRHGGRAAFVAALDAFFNQGGHTQANEPDLLVPWLYAYAGRPDRIADRVWGILERSYAATRKGLPGNDDAGTMSAWYVFAALGLYPNAGQDVYLLGSPLFPRAELALGGGKRLVITAQGVSPRNRYVQSLTLNGQPWGRCWLRHRDLANGGALTFVMGPQPSSWATLATPPPSQSSP
jgi:predicted alpha-1,2-mannosidase